MIVGLLVKNSSKGPIYYRGVRSGLDGKEFKIYKFRTMVEDAENIAIKISQISLDD